MNLQVRLSAAADFPGFARQVHLGIASGARSAAEKLAARAKIAFRGAVKQAGLGDRVANAVRVNIYPNAASVHTHAPAVYVYSRTPELIFAFSEGVTITRKGGLWLAIPTENVPRVARTTQQADIGRRGTRFQSRASPKEVEERFGKLIFIHGRGGQMLAFVDARKTKGGKLRSAVTKSGGRSKRAELILMFVMVRQVHLRKRFDWNGIGNDLGQSWVDLFGSEIANSLRTVH